MSKIVVYPAFERSSDCADLIVRLAWHLRPHAAAIERIALYAPFEELPVECDPALDQEVMKAEESKPLLEKIARTAPPENAAAWKEAFAAADSVLVWRIPEGRAFASMAELAEAAGRAKVVAIDEAASRDATTNLADFAAGLSKDRERLVAISRDRFLSLRRSITNKTVYLYGTGPSLDETERYDLSDGHAIVCNEIIANDARMARLHPLVATFADPILHAGPSAAAAAFRKAVSQQMQKRSFTLVVPFRDYLPLLTVLPRDVHERVVGLPTFAEGGLAIDLATRFSVKALPNVMTQIMLPLAATLFETIGICGADGRSAAEESAFWTHHHGSQFDAQVKALEAAHPAYAQRSETEAYQRYCTDLDRLCRTIERRGHRIVGVTASYIPALRRRGAAEPIARPKQAVADGQPIVLSVTPDLRDKIGHFWNYEQRLGPKIESGGQPYWIAANALWAEADAEDEVHDADRGTIDCSLYTFSWSLANKPEESEAYHVAMKIQVLRELRAATERALAASDGRLHVYMYCGSLEHAEILYEIARDHPRMSVHVNLFWFRTAEAWKPDFLQRWMWLLKASETDPRLTLTCMTAHQRREILQRSGVSLPVAAHPSPLIGDDRAWELLNGPMPERKTKRVFFPSANRPEKGTGLLYEAARLVVEQIGDRQIELIFRTSPFTSDVKAEEDPIFPYAKVLDGHIEEADFIDVLRGCNAVVLPYLPPDFADRTSGIAVDALYCGTPTVVMRGTSLAEIVQRYASGIVIDEGRPEEMAEAIIDLLLSDGPPTDFREGAKLYFRSNSWQRLAEEILESQPGANQAPIRRQFPDSRLRPVSLIGPVPREQEGRSDELQATAALLAGMEIAVGAPLLLEQRRDMPLGLVTEDGGQFAIAASSRAAELAARRANRTDPVAASKLVVEPAAAGGKAGFLEQVTAFGAKNGPSQCSLLLGNDPASALSVLAVAEEVRPKAALITFDDEVAPAQIQLVERLQAMGYLVLLAEHQPRLRRFEVPTFRHLAAYPFVSDLPWASGVVMALPAQADLRTIKQRFLEAGTDLDYQEPEDPTERGIEIWEAAGPPDRSQVLRAASTPNADWRLEGFDLTGRRRDGFAVLNETDALRVHRTAIRGQAKAGKPLTFAIDIADNGRRFVTLWLTDARNQPRAEATFDLEKSGMMLRSQVFMKDVEIFAVAVPLETSEDGKPTFRAWLSVERYPATEEVQAQLVTRIASMGGLQHQGEPDKGVLARNFLLEVNATPSLFDAKALGL